MVFAVLPSFHSLLSAADHLTRTYTVYSVSGFNPLAAILVTPAAVVPVKAAPRSPGFPVSRTSTSYSNEPLLKGAFQDTIKLFFVILSIFTEPAAIGLHVGASSEYT